LLRVCCDDSCWVDAAAYVGTTTSQGGLGYEETYALEAMIEATKRIDTHLMGSDDGFVDHFIMSFQF
jgi:gamma-tubulin complex component 3